MHYCDHNATSPLRPESLAAMTHALGVCGNPSSVHANGRAARAIVESYFHAGAALFYAVLCALFVLASASVIFLLHAAW